MTIRLSPHDREILEHLYLEFRIPSDQYQRREQDLNRFVRRWNALTERDDTPGEILHYIITKRKNSDWITLDGDYKRLDTMPEDFLSSEEWKTLEGVYDELVANKGLGSDTLAFDDDLANQIRREFAKRAGRLIHCSLLVAAIIAKRKRGEWVKLSPSVGKNGHVGFRDIDEIAG